MGENAAGGVFEPGMKTGSMVSAFMNSCYGQTGIPVVGVSCSKGGSGILEWQRDSAYDKDANKRYESALQYLKENHIRVRSVSMAWCQGCTDAEEGMAETEYYNCTKAMSETWLERGIGQIFLIRIGNHRDRPELYVPVQRAQKRLADSMDRVILVSELFAGFAKGGLMKDCYHYKQEGYNLVGAEAGDASGRYLNGNYGI